MGALYYILKLAKAMQNIYLPPENEEFR